MADDKRWREVIAKLDEINEKLTAVAAALEALPKPAPTEKPAPAKK